MAGEAAERHEQARAAYEHALAAYEVAREKSDRVAEFEAAAAVDRTRRAYFDARNASGIGPEERTAAAPRRAARRYRPIVDTKPQGQPGAWLRVAFNLVLPLLLFVGLALPIGAFAVRETQRGSSLNSDAIALGKGGGAAAARAPALTFARTSPERAASRILDLPFTSDVPLQQATVILAPDPGVPCSAPLDSPTQGRVRCTGPLPGGRDFTLRLTAASVFGPASAATFELRTQDQLTRLTNVKWFTEFEDPNRDPLACAAASCRIIESFTTGQDPLTAYAILALGRPLNRSRDPGLDPAAIAEVLHRMDARNTYHYYVYSTREELTRAAAWWLARSGKPVVVMSLGGQHAPLFVGFTGELGSSVNDPATRIASVIVMDPQRGDLDPRTAKYRPDKPRAQDYQTGHELSLTEWYRDEWWLGSPYWYADRGTSMDRSDGAYSLPHWSGSFVLVADDGDASTPFDRMGRVTLP